MYRNEPSRAAALFAVACAALVCGCGGDPPTAAGQERLDIECSIPVTDVHRGARRGTIPGLSNPRMAAWGETGTEYLALEDRVVGVVLGGEPVAIPLNILWWHEIVNLDGAAYSVAVTHCPLTGSSLVFERSVVGGAELDVSGLLYENNLMMYDRVGASESLWPQMARGARCGPLDGTALPMVAAIEMTWEAWRSLHPDSRVPTSETGHFRDYTEYPYAGVDDPRDDYDRIDNDFTLFPIGPGLDRRRPPKERVLGIPDGDGAHAFPYGELRELGFTGAVHGSTSGGDYVVFWDTDAEGGAAYRPEVDGQALTFQGAGSWILDDQTGSRWRVDGVAVDGAMAGKALEPIPDAFVAFWFAWPVFYAEVELWANP